MKLIPEYNRDLLHRYDRPLPRYTSYPTAVKFEACSADNKWQQALQNRGEKPHPFSLYFHIPFCRSLCFYCACSKIITPNQSRSLPYLDALFKEIAWVAKQIPSSQRVVSQIHLGGGTPTFLSQQQLTDLWLHIKEHFQLVEGGEYSIEIDPRACSVDTIEHLQQLGFNRMSFGIQDLDPEVQKAVNRIQSAEETFAQINAAKQRGVESVNVDLIYGLPKQTRATFANTLDQVIAVRPERAAVYGYAHLPSMFKAQTQIDKYSLPSLAEKLGLLELAIDRFHEAGYEYIGMDHFALPDDELAVARQNGSLQRNFQGYSTQKQCDMLGFGVTSIGKIGGLYYQNLKTEKDYLRLIAEGQSPVAKDYRMSCDDHVRGSVIMSLMCAGRLDFAQFEQQAGASFESYFRDVLPELRALEKDHLIKVSDSSLDVLPVGQLLLRNICNVFDAYRSPSKSSPSKENGSVIHTRSI